MRTGLTKLQAAAITAATTEEAKVRAAAEVMVERPLDLIKHILMRHEQAVIEVMREQQERIAALESVLKTALWTLDILGHTRYSVEEAADTADVVIHQIKEVLHD